MIKIKAVYIGDATESFVERNFSDGINVIYSMDNNRGKTVLMQGIMYTLGALPTFPSSFPYRDYIYIADRSCSVTVRGLIVWIRGRI